jgi:hypothetical protein
MDKPIIKIDGSSEPYVRPEVLSEFLGVKPDTLCDWARRYPDFPHLALPGSLRFRVSEVEAWLKTLPGTFKSKKDSEINTRIDKLRDRLKN